jgi:hypothetical protein
MAQQQDDKLRARVFISCGQNKTTKETEIASAISDRLTKLGFDPYIAVGEQTLRGLTENLFEQLENSEYFVFVDFKRERLDGADLHRGSLFSHQELGVASYLQIEVLAFQEQGVKKDDGILGFVQGNAIPFDNREGLPDQVAKEVKRRIDDGRWNPQWRNELVIEHQPGQFVEVLNVQNGQWHRYFHVGVHNHHHRKTARNCCAYLERVTRLDTNEEIPFRPFELKWEGYVLPNVHIAHGKDRNFDGFCVLRDGPKRLLFLGFCDASYILPVIDKPGRCELTYLVVADNFANVRRSFALTLNDSLDVISLE